MKTKLLIAATLCCLLLSSCSGMSLTGSDVLSPPLAQGEQSELQQLIKDNTSGSYSLIYPSSGEYQNAVVFRDIDRDGEDEAVAMYKGPDEGSRILFACRSDSGYTSLGEANLQSSLIEKADFADLNGDGKEEFIVTYPEASSPLCSLSVIGIGGEITRIDMSACCNTFVIDDFDGDQVKDLLLLSLAGTSGTASAKLLNYDGSVLSVKTSCEMDSQLSGYAKITCGGISEGVVGAVVDGYTPAGEYTTQVIYFDTATESLVNPLFIYMGYDSTRRTTLLSSADIDRDGLIEIPICSLCEYAPDESVAEVCRQVSWNSFNIADISMTRKKTAVLCEDEGFLFNISDSRTDAVTARRSADGDILLYIWGGADGEPGCTDLLLTVKRYPKNSYDSTRVLEAKLGETATSVFTYIINPVDSDLCYTDEDVAGSFVLLEQH